MLYLRRRKLNSILLILYLSSTLTVILVSSARADDAIEIKGTFRECLGPANAKKYDITNKINEPIHDFTITIKKDGGGDIAAKITRVEDHDDGGDCHQDFDVDDDMIIEHRGTNEFDNIDDSPGTTTRIQAFNKNNAIPTNGPHHLNIMLDPAANEEWCITIQPTDRDGKAIGKGLKSMGFDGINSYGVTLTEEAAQIAPYTGLAFNDLNITGDTLTTLFLSGNGFEITDAYQKDANGVEIPGSIFNPTDYSLEFAESVADGQVFFVAVEVSQFFGGNPMMVQASTSALIPTVSEWGLIIMALLLLTAGTVMIRRRLRPVSIGCN